ncbi:hypothetical protein EYF80_043640 [Liparis tanakae]|uniref:Uncharacterized protein n=1 Tax=Liparis tanakae TaxID=230148 RepID=A0A4Z2FZW1_9TELE|nr:hypothetical protein EYF80_043640 [Liparis tanakae]
MDPSQDARCHLVPRAHVNSGTVLWVSERKDPAAAKNDRRSGNNGTPSRITVASFQLVVSALARERRDDLTDVVAPLAKRTEKKGRGNERNALIAAKERM